MNRPRGLPYSAAEKALERRGIAWSEGWLPRGYIDGLILSNNSGDTSNDIDIAPGVCRSISNMSPNGRSTASKDQRDIEITTTLTKQIDVAWAPGNGGIRSSSALSNTTWHFFAIGGPGMKDDVFAHAAVDISSVLPSGYTAWRRIGSMIRSAGAFRQFSQAGDEFLHKTVVTTWTTALTTTEDLVTVEVPVGIVVWASIGVYANRGTNSRVFLTSPAANNDALDTSLARITAAAATGSGTPESAANVIRRTDTSGRIRAISDATQSNTSIATFGWIDQRGKDA
jgi:hypothetical protein